MVSLVVSVVDFGTVGYNETETDNTAAFSLRAASQPVAAAGGGEAPSGEGRRAVPVVSVLLAPVPLRPEERYTRYFAGLCRDALQRNLPSAAPSSETS